MFASDGSLVFGVKDGARSRIMRMPAGSRGRRIRFRGRHRRLDPSPGGPGRILYVRGEHLADAAEAHTVPLDGTDDRVEVPGIHGWVTGHDLLRPQRHAAASVALRPPAWDETLFEAASGKKFYGVVASPDGASVATSITSLLVGESTPDLCFGPIAFGTALDCSSAGKMRSGIPTFSPTSRSIYFGGSQSIGRFDTATKERMEQPFVIANPAKRETTRTPVAFAIAPDGTRLVAQMCGPRNEYARLVADGTFLPFEVEHSGAGFMSVASDGRAALAVKVSDHGALSTTDPNGKNETIITSDDHRIAASAFSPSGDAIAFQDLSKTAGGLWVIAASGQTSPHRVTTNPSDNSVTWLDDDTLIFQRPEKGYVYGRGYQVPAAGGEPSPLPDGPGLILGPVPSKRILFRADPKDDGFHLFQQKVGGGRATPVLIGDKPFVFRPDRTVSLSVTGRWLAWFEGNNACTLDFEKTARACLRMPSIGARPVSLQADASNT